MVGFIFRMGVLYTFISFLFPLNVENMKLPSTRESRNKSLFSISGRIKLLGHFLPLLLLLVLLLFLFLLLIFFFFFLYFYVCGCFAYMVV